MEAWTNPETGLQFTHPADMAALRATAVLFAQFLAMGDYLEAVDPRSGRARGPLNHNGQPRNVMRIFASTYTTVMNGLKALGATPAARAEMMSNLASGAGAASQLAKARKAQQ